MTGLLLTKYFKATLVLTLVFLGFISFTSVAKAAIVNTSTYTYAVKDFGSASASLVFSWNATTNASTSVTMQVRSGTTVNPVSDSDPNWTAWTSVNSGDSLTGAYLANRYFQYRATLNSQDINYVPTLDDVTIAETAIPSSSSLISSIYDSGSNANIIPKVAWTGAGTSTNSALKFQVRSANSTSSLLTAPWCGYGDTSPTCDGAHYFDYTQNGKQISDLTHPLLANGGQYFQYQAFITSADGVSTSTLNDVTVTYVVNAAPEFETSTTASQRSDGKVQIDYSILDSDTMPSGVGCPNCVIASLEYSANSGSTWAPIANTYLANATGATGLNAGFGTTTVSASVSSTYSVLWDAKSQLNGLYNTTMKLRVTLNDLEGGNNLAVTTTNTFTLDVKNPDLGKAGNSTTTLNGIVVIATTTPATVLLSATDDDPGLKMCLTNTNPGANILPDSSCQPYAPTATTTLITDPATVYVQFKDSYSNVTNIHAVTPETPTSMVTRDISDLTNDAYQEFVVWKAVSLPFYKYHLWYEVDDTSGWQELNAISDRALNYFYHQNLTGGLTYRYKTFTEDALGNTSYFSSEVYDKTDGIGGTNITPPQISNVTIISTSTQGAVISWDTDVLANSNIYYSTVQPGMGTSFDETVGTVTMLDNPTGLGAHRIAISNLSPDTTYYFQIQSVNSLGISATNSNGGEGYQFTTKSGPIISGVTASQVSNNSATIVWNTDIPADSHVYYSSSSQNFATTFGQSGSGDPVTSHSISISGLERGTTYYYSISSGIATDDNGGNYYSFTTPVDNIPPVITNVTSTIVIDTQAVISFNTSELANAKIVYGLAPDTYTGMATNSAIGLNHQVVLSSLSSSTVYYYRAVSSDTSGNISTSSEYSFTTLEILSPESLVRLREAAANAQGNIEGVASTVAAMDALRQELADAQAAADAANASSTILNAALDVANAALAAAQAAVNQAASDLASTTASNTTALDALNQQHATELAEAQAALATAQAAATAAQAAANAANASSTISNAALATVNAALDTANAALATAQAAVAQAAADLASATAANATELASAQATLATAQAVAAAAQAAANAANASSTILNVALDAANAALNAALAAAVPVAPPSCGGGGSTIINIDRTLPKISSIKVSEIKGDSATVSWTSDKKGNSLVEYGQNNSYGLGSFTKLESSLDHSVVLRSLSPSITYHYKVDTVDANGNLGTSPDATFTTTDALGLSTDSLSNSTSTNDAIFTAALNKIASYFSAMSGKISLPVLETSLNSQYNLIRSLSTSVPAPLLSGEPRVTATADTATITWHTDKNANSLVAIAPSNTYDKTKGNQGYAQVVGNPTEANTLHIVTISSLVPETLYHYQVRSMDNLGAQGASTDFTFTTKPKQLEISSYTIVKANANTATFRWLTNNETDSQVQYAPYRNGVLAIDAAKTVKDKNFSTLHEIKVDNFESGINYEVNLSGKDLKGQIIAKKISSFSTGEDNFPPTISQVQTESALSTGKESNVQTIISWLTDEPATGQAFYQKGVGTVSADAWNKTPLDPNYSKKHIVVLTKFEPGQVYQFKLESADSNNNLASSKVYTILAPKQKESVFQVILKNFESIFGWTNKLGG